MIWVCALAGSVQKISKHLPITSYIRILKIFFNILIHEDIKDCNSGLILSPVLCRILRSWHKRSICDLSNFVIATTCSLIRKSRIPTNKKVTKAAPCEPNEKSQNFYFWLSQHKVDKKKLDTIVFHTISPSDRRNFLFYQKDLDTYQ